MSKVYVIMGNDFPSDVFKDKDEAEKHVAELKAKDKETHVKERPNWPYSPRIHWRFYEFELK